MLHSHNILGPPKKEGMVCLASSIPATAISMLLFLQSNELYAGINLKLTAGSFQFVTAAIPVGGSFCYIGVV